jgi:hypothetical protein
MEAAHSPNITEGLASERGVRGSRQTFGKERMEPFPMICEE